MLCPQFVGLCFYTLLCHYGSSIVLVMCLVHDVLVLACHTLLWIVYISQEFISVLAYHIAVEGKPLWCCNHGTYRYIAICGCC